MTKLKIDLFSGTIEVDGEVDFVRSVYGDFKHKLMVVVPKKVESSGQELDTAAGNSQSNPRSAISQPTDEAGTALPQPMKAKIVVRKRTQGHLTFLKQLDLSEVGNDFNLVDFYAAKSPQTAMESNVVFVYYLQSIARLVSIGVDHIYTCYKTVGKKFPNALRQSLADTSNRKKWLDTSSFEDIQLTPEGENYVEHELPKRDGI